MWGYEPQNLWLLSVYCLCYHHLPIPIEIYHCYLSVNQNLYTYLSESTFIMSSYEFQIVDDLSMPMILKECIPGFGRMENLTLTLFLPVKFHLFKRIYLKISVPFYLKYDFVKHDVRGTIADSLWHIYMHLSCHSIQKLINRTIIVTFKHKWSFIGLNKDDTSLAMSRYLKRLDFD